MIYTITFNPALDYSLNVKELTMGVTNRADDDCILAGGKGLNVSAVLENLGTPNVALGFIAGFTGDEIERRFNADGYKSDFIRLKTGASRINVKIKSDTETEINASGPDINGESLAMLMEKLNILGEGDMVVLAGSIPKSLPDTLYCDIMAKLSGKGVRFVVDATGDLLVNSLKYKPFLIKPNRDELGDIFGTEIKTKDEAVECAFKLKGMGAVNVLVSLGDKGAVLVAENGEILKCDAPKGKIINSVGAGDSMVAGFIAGWEDSRDYDYALKLGVAAGSASTFSATLADKAAVFEIYKEL